MLLLNQYYYITKNENTLKETFRGIRCTYLVLMRVNINGNICNRAVKNFCLCCRDWWCCCCGCWYSRRRRSSDPAADDPLLVVVGGGLVGLSTTVVSVAAVAIRIHTVHVHVQISFSTNEDGATAGEADPAIPFLLCQSSSRDNRSSGAAFLSFGVIFVPSPTLLELL